ncbi:hypothetical protein HOLleu_03973 [Holothuria leucospilota]|uniref:DUF5641 domain-containing protein n=1 Tax=Holothuria leucospilota TaxID=206669 RepID=A0A9Q1CT97_HOLLE|nr:hypothetical protein HOLleu_03973 [Holothuria leucospilota]
MAAVLGVRLAKSGCQALELDMRHVTFWSDRVNVLWWVRGHSPDVMCMTTSHLPQNNFLQAGGQFAKEAVDGISFNQKRRWRSVQELIRHVWHRWLKEWLLLLNQRRKWQLPQKNLQVGNVVVAVDAGSARGNWPLERVVEVFPGGDGNFRVVKLQVWKNISTTPISRLCPVVEGEN